MLTDDEQLKKKSQNNLKIIPINEHSKGNEKIYFKNYRTQKKQLSSRGNEKMLWISRVNVILDRIVKIMNST